MNEQSSSLQAQRNSAVASSNNSSQRQLQQQIHQQYSKNMSESMKRLRMTDVQTPSNFTASQNTFDEAEIYDSVKSLSQALDDSLNYKKEQARLYQAHAHREIMEEMNGQSPEEEYQYGTEQESSAFLSGDSPAIQSPNQEMRSQPMSALQLMLRKSELFIKKQASDQKQLTTTSQQAEDDEDDNLDYNSQSQSQSNENDLPIVHPQESSFLEGYDGENGFDEYNNQQEMGMGTEDMMLLMQNSSNNHNTNPADNYEESDQITSESDIMHQQTDSLSQSLQSVREHEKTNRQEDHLRASNLQDEEKLIPMKHESSHVRSQKELETMNVSQLLNEVSVSELTVLRNSSFITMIKANTASQQEDYNKSSIHQVSQLVGHGPPTDSLNALSASADAMPQNIETIETLNSHSSNSNSQFATPVIGAQHQIMQHYEETKQLIDEATYDLKTSQSAVVSPPQFISIPGSVQHKNLTNQNAATTTPQSHDNSFEDPESGFEPSQENYGSMRVYENEHDKLNCSQSAGIVFAVEDEEEEAFSKVEEEINLSSRNTVRQSIDDQSLTAAEALQNSEQKLKNNLRTSHLVSIDSQTGTIEIGSSESNSDSPQQVSAKHSISIPDTIEEQSYHKIIETKKLSIRNNLAVIQTNDLSFDDGVNSSAGEIKVMNFAKSGGLMDSCSDLDAQEKLDEGNHQLIQIEEPKNSDFTALNLNHINQQQTAGSRSEVKDNNGLGLILGIIPMQPYPSSLSNSLKKVGAPASSTHNQSSQYVDDRVRSYSDVLNAMRDTEEIEKEKRELNQDKGVAAATTTVADESDTREVSPFKQASDCNAIELLNIQPNQDEIIADDAGNGDFEQSIEVQKTTNIAPQRKSQPEKHIIGFAVDHEGNKSNQNVRVTFETQPILVQDHEKYSKTFQFVKKGHHLAAPTTGSMVEIYSDSLNTKSEDKKYHSNSNDEEHRSSPSFYKLNTSENEFEIEVREDSKLLVHDNTNNKSYRKSFIPASSFASGAQAQIEYTDKLSSQQMAKLQQQEEDRAHQRVTSQPTAQQNSSSHYRGESFGNCLPLASVGTSSQRDSSSQYASGKRQKHANNVKHQNCPSPLITEGCTEEEDSSSRKEQEGSQNIDQSQPSGCTISNSQQLDDVILIEDNLGDEQELLSGDEIHRQLNHNGNESGDDEDLENRQMTKSLSKTDSLRDLNAFFSRDQLKCKTDGEYQDSEEGFQSNEQYSNNQMVDLNSNRILYQAEVIAEENLEESSPERHPQRMSKQTTSSRQGTQQQSISSDLQIQLKLIQRDSQRLPATSTPLIEIAKMKEAKRISLQEMKSKSGSHNPAKTHEQKLSFSMADESEVFAANGPAQSVNQSEYSILKNLVEKISKSPKQHNSFENMAEDLGQEISTLRNQNTQYREANQKLQLKLIKAEQKIVELETQKNQAVALYEKVDAHSQISNEQLNNEQQNAFHQTSKYNKLKAEFRKMKQKYESELTSCVREMENLRVIVVDVVSQQSESKAMLRASSSTKKPKVIAPVHFVQSSTGEPNLLPENEHTQSEKVLGLTCSLNLRPIVPYREETTSSESPVRPNGRSKLVKPNGFKQRSGRFSSHEQFSINSSQAQIARFSGDFSKNNNKVISEYADDKSSIKGTIVRYKRAGAETKSNSKNRQTKTRQPVANTTSESVSSTSFKKTRQLLLKFTDAGSESRQSNKQINNSITADSSSRSKQIMRSRHNLQHLQHAQKMQQQQKDESVNHSVIPERTEEDYASVFQSNRRTIDLVKQTMSTGGIFHQVKRQEKLKKTQNLQNMLANLYSQSRQTHQQPKAVSQDPPSSDQRKGMNLSHLALLSSSMGNSTSPISNNKKKTLLMKKRH